MAINALQLQPERIGYQGDRFDALSDADRLELLEEICYQIDLQGLEYADTIRATPEEKGIEEHIKKQSCCGSWEARYTCRSGTTYYIGCNYGH